MFHCKPSILDHFGDPPFMETAQRLSSCDRPQETISRPSNQELETRHPPRPDSGVWRLPDFASQHHNLFLWLVSYLSCRGSSFQIGWETIITWELLKSRKTQTCFILDGIEHLAHTAQTVLCKCHGLKMPTVQPCRTALDYTGVSGMVCLLCLCGENTKLSEWWCRNLRLMFTVWNLEADDAELCVLPSYHWHVHFTQPSLSTLLTGRQESHASTTQTWCQKAHFGFPCDFLAYFWLKAFQRFVSNGIHYTQGATASLHASGWNIDHGEWVRSNSATCTAQHPWGLFQKRRIYTPKTSRLENVDSIISGPSHNSTDQFWKPQPQPQVVHSLTLTLPVLWVFSPGAKSSAH